MCNGFAYRWSGGCFSLVAAARGRVGHLIKPYVNTQPRSSSNKTSKESGSSTRGRTTSPTAASESGTSSVSLILEQVNEI